MLDQLATLRARLSRKRKILEAAQKRGKEKMNYLVEEMKADSEDVYKTVIDASSLEAELFEPSDFPSLDVVLEGSSSGIVAESSGS